MAGEVRWVKIAGSVAEISFAGNGIAVVTAGEKTICLARKNNVLYAFAEKCPHASGLLAEGFIDALGNVVCPLHRYKFCLKNGRNVSGEGYYLKHWPVKEDENGVFVGLPPSTVLDLL